VSAARRLLFLFLVLWLGRWFARELASRIGHQLLAPGPPPIDSPRPPGWMPGSFGG
jgi:hypothetical protein